MFASQKIINRRRVHGHAWQRETIEDFRPLPIGHDHISNIGGGRCLSK